MNAAYSASQQTAADQRGHEPSMEEILASIRRIIADDQVLPLSRSQASAARSAPPEQHQFAEPHDHYDDAPSGRHVGRAEPQSPPPSLDQFRRDLRDSAPQRVARPTYRPDLEPIQRAEPEPPLRSFEQPTMRDELLEQVGGALMSPTADASVSSSFNALATSMMLQNNGMVEDSIREILRPMLKSWLDDNLPGIVERLVRQEIERMSRGRR